MTLPLRQGIVSMSAETAARLIPPLSEPVDLLLDDIAIRV
jgi:hypothetical protein